MKYEYEVGKDMNADGFGLIPRNTRAHLIIGFGNMQTPKLVNEEVARNIFSIRCDQLVFTIESSHRERLNTM